MWTGIRSRAIYQSWNFYLWFYNMSLTGVFTNICIMDIYGQAVNIDWPRPFNLSRSWQILNVAHPFTVSLCYSSVSGSLLADSEFDSSNVMEFTSISMLPFTTLLGSNIEVEARKCWSIPFYLFIVCVECDFTWSLCEIFFSV